MARNMALGARGEDVAVEFLIDAGLEIMTMSQTVFFCNSEMSRNTL